MYEIIHIQLLYIIVMQKQNHVNAKPGHKTH